jgi:mRNA interferase HigB
MALRVNVVARSALVAFWTRYPRSEVPLRAWYGQVTKATWAGPADIKRLFGNTVDFIGENRIIFDIGGNKYRLIARVSYTYKACQIKFVGTHAEYDAVDPLTVEIG